MVPKIFEITRDGFRFPERLNGSPGAYIGSDAERRSDDFIDRKDWKFRIQGLGHGG